MRTSTPRAIFGALVIFLSFLFITTGSAHPVNHPHRHGHVALDRPRPHPHAGHTHIWRPNSHGQWLRPGPPKKGNSGEDKTRVGGHGLGETTDTNHFPHRPRPHRIPDGNAKDQEDRFGGRGPNQVFHPKPAPAIMREEEANFEDHRPYIKPGLEHDIGRSPRPSRFGDNNHHEGQHRHLDVKPRPNRTPDEIAAERPGAGLLYHGSDKLNNPHNLHKHTGLKPTPASTPSAEGGFYMEEAHRGSPVRIPKPRVHGGWGKFGGNETVPTGVSRVMFPRPKLSPWATPGPGSRGV